MEKYHLVSWASNKLGLMIIRDNLISHPVVKELINDVGIFQTHTEFLFGYEHVCHKI